MRNLSLSAMGYLAICGLSATAQAQLNQTFVASYGADANTCSIAQPCRTFSGAIAKTSAGGAIIALDSAEFGGVLTIDKSISVIVPPEVHGVLHPPSGQNAININAPGATVTLRGLYLNGQVGETGISVTAVSILSVENCLVANFRVGGIDFAAAGRLFVRDSIIRNNATGNTSGSGILVIGQNASNKAYGSISNSRVERNGTGLGLSAGVAVQQFAEVSVRNTTAAGNFRGFAASASGGAAIRLAIEGSSIENNVVGVFAADHAGVIVRVSNSAIRYNTFLGLEAQGTAQITSLGDNTVSDNSGNEKFTGSFAPQ